MGAQVQPVRVGFNSVFYESWKSLANDHQTAVEQHQSAEEKWA